MAFATSERELQGNKVPDTAARDKRRCSGHASSEDLAPLEDFVEHLVQCASIPIESTVGSW